MGERAYGNASATFENKENFAMNYTIENGHADAGFVLDVNADKVADYTLTVHDGVATFQQGNQPSVPLPASVAQEAMAAVKALCVNDPKDLPAGVDSLESMRNIANFLKAPNGNHIELAYKGR